MCLQVAQAQDSRAPPHLPGLRHPDPAGVNENSPRFTVSFQRGPSKEADLDRLPLLERTQPQRAAPSWSSLVFLFEKVGRGKGGEGH